MALISAQCRAGMKHEKQSITVTQMCAFVSQIAKGMAYLEEQQVAHGDLSAFVLAKRNYCLCSLIFAVCRRNVLVGDGGSMCKISDFGHSEDIYGQSGFSVVAFASV